MCNIYISYEKRSHLATYFIYQGFPNSSVGKESACNAWDPSLIPGLGRSAGKRYGNPLQYSCLENSMGYHGVVESWTRLNNFHFSPQLLYSTVNRHLDCFHVFAIVSSAAKNIGADSLSLHQRIFPTQESNQDLLPYRRILYQLKYQGSP